MNKCNKCGYKWEGERFAKSCPNCKSYRWKGYTPDNEIEKEIETRRSEILKIIKNLKNNISVRDLYVSKTFSISYKTFSRDVNFLFDKGLININKLRSGILGNTTIILVTK